MPLEASAPAGDGLLEPPASPFEAWLRSLAAALAVAAVGLQASGYLSLRFRIRALGIEPEVSLLTEQVLFEGAYLLVFLLTVLPMLLMATALLAAPFWLLSRIPTARKRMATLAARLSASPSTLTVLAGLWGVGTVQLLLRKVLHYHDLLFRTLPCEPWWLRRQALAPGSDAAYSDAFFAFLLLVPIPTLWAALRLWRRPGWRVAGLVLGALALVQVLLVPIHFGILVRNGDVPRIAALSQDEHAAPGDRIWIIFRTPDVVHYLVRPRDPEASDRILEVEGESGVRLLEVEAFDRMYQVLAEGQVCE